MFKKFWIIFSVFVIWFNAIYYNGQPVFREYAKSFTVYVGENSSNALFKSVSSYGYPFILNRFGESCIVDGNDFDLSTFAKRFCATEVLVENIGEGVSHYFYSSKIKYVKTLNGQKVNLHVFIGKDNVVLGSPLIYGSF